MLIRIFIFLGIVLLGIQPSTGQIRENNAAFRDSVSVVAAAKSFLSAWLVKRNLKEAMGFVASKPVLSRKCDLPPGTKRAPGSPLRKREVIRQFLSTSMKSFPRYDSLSLAIERTEIPSADWFDIEEGDGFQLLRIKPGHDGYLMCKFEENVSYRNSMLRPDAYYFSFKVKDMQDERLREWISLWAPENHQWRLLSIGLLED
jgi:hypothetical protein